jgi:peroxiredoxin
MKAYREKYAKVREKGAEVVAISSDDVDTLKRFKAEVEAPFLFLSDSGGQVAAAFAGATHTSSSRATYDVDSDGKIVHVTQGLGAIFPEGDVKACPLHKGAAEPPPSSI